MGIAIAGRYSEAGRSNELQVVSAVRELLVTVREAVGMTNRQDGSYESFRVDVEQSQTRKALAMVAIVASSISTPGAIT
jgi:hypothetical protein